MDSFFGEGLHGTVQSLAVRVILLTLAKAACVRMQGQDALVLRACGFVVAIPRVGTVRILP